MIASIVSRTRWLIRARSTTAAVIQTAAFQVITIVANLATGIITARLLAPAGRGELAAINLVPTIMAYLLTLGVPGALLYHLKREADNAPRLIAAALVVTTGLGVIAVIIGYSVMPYALREYPPHVVALARLFLFTTPISLFTLLCTSAFDSAGDFWYGNGTRFLAPLLTLASLCAFWGTGRLDVFTAAASYALPSLPIGAKMLTDVVRHYRPVFVPIARAVYGQLFSYGLRSFGISLLTAVAQQIDQVLVVAFLTPAKMGLYAVALAVSRVLQIFQSSVVRVLLPKIAARPVDEVVASVGRATRITLVLTTPLCIGVVVLAPLLLGLVYGGKFAGATGVLRVLAVEAIFGGIAWILSQAFLALGKPGIVTVLQGIGVALSFPLMVVLIPRMGLVGAGLSLLVSTVVRVAFVTMCFPWLLKARAPGFLLTNGDVDSLRQRFRLNRPSVIEPKP
jgi:O-antigen/teichoic acid export membrane protein